MARRRRGWKRVSPERGWLNIGIAGSQGVPGGELLINGFSSYLPLVQFADVDNDDDGTFITHDKSNWFCVRILLDVVVRGSNGSIPSATATNRIEHQLLLATAKNDVIINFTDNTNPSYAGQPFSSEWYGGVARIVQSDLILSQPWGIAPGLTSAEFTRTDNTNANEKLYDAAAPTWMHKSYDLSTRFSLFTDSSLVLVYGGSAYTTENGAGWLEGGVQYCSVQLRSLWQKGRSR